MRLGVVNKNGERLADKYGYEKFHVQRAQDEPEKIFFLPECWENFIESIRYKPGWKFEYDYEIDFDQEKLYISLHVPDRDDPEKLVTVSQWWFLKPWESGFVAKEFIRKAIAELEIHELEENLLIDGVRVFDPHKKEPCTANHVEECTC